MGLDVLIIGSGGAGLSGALMAKESGAEVLVVSESYPTRAQTSMAQGGLNAVLPNSNDTIENHINDTIKASCGLGDKKMIELLCQDAPKTVEWLNSIGVPFSIDQDGNIAQRKLGGTKHERACYSQDYTGLKIIQTIYDNSLKEEINYLNEHYLLELIVENNIARGAIFLDIRSGEVKEILAKSVILATGGYCGLYYNHTTNMYSQNGDGIVLAKKAGAKVSGLEFVQFHPTGLKSSSVLISESARGAGGKLINQKGERFVDELKPRDVVSLAIWMEIEKGNEVFLDIRDLGSQFIDEHLPQERKLSIFYEKVDPVHKVIPIKPVAHYSMGGVDVDKNLQSSIDGLFCVGECSNAKVHGANRLGGNSLLEIVAFGRRCGKSAYEYSKDIKEPTISKDYLEDMKQNIENIYDKTSELNFYKTREELGENLYKYAGITRDKKGLLNLEKFLENIELDRMSIDDRSRVYNTTLVEFLKFRNSIFLAKEIMKSAKKREKSCGSHFRSDDK